MPDGIISSGGAEGQVPRPSFNLVSVDGRAPGGPTIDVQRQPGGEVNIGVRPSGRPLGEIFEEEEEKDNPHAVEPRGMEVFFRNRRENREKRAKEREAKAEIETSHQRDEGVKALREV